MNLPNIPTDSLYKFLAITGAIISLIFIVVPAYTIYEIDDEINLIETEMGELKFEIDIFNEKQEKLSKEIVELDSLTNRYKYKKEKEDIEIDLDCWIEKMKNPEYRDYLEFFYKYRNEIIPEKRRLEELIILKQELENTHNEIRLKNHKIIRKVELVKLKNKKINNLIWIFFIGLLIGLLMMANGFTLWYFKVQKFLDIRIKKEVTEDDKL